MSKDLYYPQEYRCDNIDCCHRQKKYIWSSKRYEVEHECEKCGWTLNHMNEYESDVNDAFRVGTKMTKQQIKADRKKRSTEHFQKEVRPTLGGMDKRHFDRKFSK